MSRPRFVADEDFRQMIIDAVLQAEPTVDITTFVEHGRDGLPDSEQLQFALDEGLLILSHDVNTMKGEAIQRIVDGRGIAGVFFTGQHASTRAVAESILMIWGASEAEEYRDRIEHLPMP